jgi:hypothetical protein
MNRLGSTFLQSLRIKKAYKRELQVFILEKSIALVSSTAPRSAFEEIILESREQKK